MSEQIKTLAYLGPEGSFTHAEALGLKRKYPQYQETELIPGTSIAIVCQMVAEQQAQQAVIPETNSSDGLVKDTAPAVDRYSLKVRYEVASPIQQSLYYRKGADPLYIERYISKDSANGQCRHTIPKYLPYAVPESRDSTVAAILEATQNPKLAAIGPHIVGDIYHLMDKMVRIDGVHDDPLNATRFWVIDATDEETPITGNDKTSLIVRVPDKPGSLYAVLDPFVKEGVNLTKIKSFARETGSSAFLISVGGHHQEQPLTSALNSLSRQDIEIKMLGSYPRADYQPPNITREPNIEYLVDRLHNDISNGTPNKTEVVFTLQDKVGALRNALKPFNSRGINLTEIDSIPTGKLGEYAFYLAFENGVHQREEAIAELMTQCARVVLL